MKTTSESSQSTPLHSSRIGAIATSGSARFLSLICLLAALASGLAATSAQAQNGPYVYISPASQPGLLIFSAGVRFTKPAGSVGPFYAYVPLPNGGWSRPLPADFDRATGRYGAGYTIQISRNTPDYLNKKILVWDAGAQRRYWTGVFGRRIASDYGGFNGFWRSTYGDTTIVATNGGDFSGEYKYKGGSSIWGNVSANGRTLTGWWREPGASTSWGRFTATMNADGKSWTGHWGWQNGPLTGNWNGWR